MPTKDINRELKRYRLKGTHRFALIWNKLTKLPTVGSITKKRGGKRNSSPKGLKDVIMAKISGRDEKSAKNPTKNITKKSPPMPRFRRWPVLFRLKTLRSASVFKKPTSVLVTFANVVKNF